jgi:predicted secreted protein
MSGALLALALLLAADPPPAPPPGPPGAAVTVLHLRETAEKSVVPDRLRIEMRVEQSGTDPRNVQSAINRHMAAALAKARQLAGIVVRTGDYTLFQQHPPDTAAPRWRGSQSLILTGKDAAQMLQLAGELQSDGLVMSSFAYQISPALLRGIEGELTAAALAALDRRAAAIAGRLHLAILRYRDLTVGNAETGPRPVFYGAAMAGASAAPVAASGREEVRLTVSADLLLARQRP